MFDFIYEMLQKFGYTHPLHPTLTHLPIGLVLAAFVFGLIAIVFRKPLLFQILGKRQKHCLAPLCEATRGPPPVVFPTCCLWSLFWRASVAFLGSPLFFASVLCADVVCVCVSSVYVS